MTVSTFFFQQSPIFIAVDSIAADLTMGYLGPCIPAHLYPSGDSDTSGDLCFIMALRVGETIS
jgi:hypothetical protein